MSTCARHMSNWVAGLTASQIPEAELVLARARIADTAGLLVAGCTTPASGAAIDLARVSASGSDDQTGAAIIGQKGSWPFPWAAFVHGVTAHCRDFDDTFPQSVIHPGSTIVSTAMALGSSLRAQDEDILVAIVAGYEIAARLGLAGGRHLIARGFHGTGIYGPVISAVVAGKLLGLPAPQLTSAIGLSASMSSGLFEFQTDGSWSKWLHVGWSCLGGTSAAKLASSGFTGPASALEGGRGLYAAFIGLDDTDIARLTEGLGEQWLGRTALPKYYPCAHVIQPYLDLGRRLSASIETSKIERIICHVAPWAVSLVCEPLARKQSPQTEMDVIGSLPFLVAAALVDGNVTLEHLSGKSRARADLRQLATRITYRADPALGEGFDGRLEVLLHNGARECHDVDALVTDGAAIICKAQALLSHRFGTIAAKRICDGLTGARPDSLLQSWNEAMALPETAQAARHD